PLLSFLRQGNHGFLKNITLAWAGFLLQGDKTSRFFLSDRWFIRKHLGVVDVKERHSNKDEENCFKIIFLQAEEYSPYHIVAEELKTRAIQALLEQASITQGLFQMNHYLHGEKLNAPASHQRYFFSMQITGINHVAQKRQFLHWGWLYWCAPLARASFVLKILELKFFQSLCVWL
ncbi:hypothetical protein ACJX0J_041338, partial [Zea mays]